MNVLNELKQLLDLSPGRDAILWRHPLPRPVRVKNCSVWRSPAEVTIREIMALRVKNEVKVVLRIAESPLQVTLSLADAIRLVEASGLEKEGRGM